MDFSGANLSGANLSGADLEGADLVGADLEHADFHSANLLGCVFNKADLRFASFGRARTLNWESHDLVAEMLRRAAYHRPNDVLSLDQIMARRKLAGLVLMSRDQCWPNFARLASPAEWEWACGVFAEYVDAGCYLLDELPNELAEFLRIRDARAAAKSDPAPVVSGAAANDADPVLTELLENFV